MFDKLNVLQMAGRMAQHAAARQEVIARNVANADTPGYRAQDVMSFAATYDGAPAPATLRATRAGHIAQDTSDATRPAVVDAPGPSSPNGNTVSLETEMMKTAEVRHEHELALSVYQSSLNILRTAIGRR